jgi:ABC-type Fe3+-hydroxamate transport system substrate-binding protein
MRIVSLVPSVTETLLAFGVTPVGVTRFCEHPELHAVGGTKDPDIDAIVALAPDLVVLCEEENRREDAEALAGAGVPTCALVIDDLDDAALAVQVLAGFASVVHEPVALPSAHEGPPVRAFVPIWRRPWMTMNGSTYGSSVLAHLGVVNIFADDATRYPEVTLEAVASRRPDVVLAPSEPYPFGTRHIAELAEIAPVELVDGQDLFWWGIRTPDAVERLARRLAPLLRWR